MAISQYNLYSNSLAQLDVTFREYPIRTDVSHNNPNKFQAYHLKPLGQFSIIDMILPRFELE